MIVVYSDLARDPRGRTVSVAYAVRLPRAIQPQAGSDAQSADWTGLADQKARLNNAEIIADAEAAMANRDVYVQG